MHFRVPTLLACFFWSALTIADDNEQRYQEYLDLIKTSRHEQPWVQIHLVNNFVNRTLSYRSDQEQYGSQDLWVGPSVSMRSGFGDCEDYAFAKYVALRAMGIPDDQLLVAYVRSQPGAAPHMVLHYIPGGDGTPLVLDSASPSIAATKERTDLRTIYSFNESGIWLPSHSMPFLPMTNQHWRSILEEITGIIKP